MKFITGLEPKDLLHKQDPKLPEGMRRISGMELTTKMSCAWSRWEKTKDKKYLKEYYKFKHLGNAKIEALSEGEDIIVKSSEM